MARAASRRARLCWACADDCAHPPRVGLAVARARAARAAGNLLEPQAAWVLACRTHAQSGSLVEVDRHRVAERPQLPAAPVPLRVLDDRAVTAARARASAHRPASPNLGRRHDHVGGGGSLRQQRPSTALLKPSSTAAHRAERCRGVSGARRHVSASGRHLCTARGRATRETGRATRGLGRVSGASSGHLGDAESGGEGARAAVARFRALGRS